MAAKPKKTPKQKAATWVRSYQRWHNLDDAGNGHYTEGLESYLEEAVEIFKEMLKK
jgi:hypothetical protein